MTLLNLHRPPASPTRLIRLSALAFVAFGLPALAACSGDTTSIGPSVDTTEDVDTVTLPDIAQEVISFDSGGSDAGSDIGLVPDTSVEPSCNAAPFPFYCPCDINTQCASGYCIQAGDDLAGMRCSQACQEECPNDWECRGLSAGGDPIFVCQPPINSLCSACERDADCRIVGAKCVTYDDGNYCGKQCTKDADCSTGYACEDVLNELGQVIATQCLRTSGSCNCPDGTNYNTDPNNCGVCGNVCAYAGAEGLCNNGGCALGPCVGPHFNLNGLEADGCEYDCVYVDEADEPDAVCNGSSCDQNCDGIDGSYALGIFVSESGSSRGDGSAAAPLNSIPAAIALAKSAGKPHVYVSAGTYTGEVILQEGVSIFGGYSNDGLWRRNLASYRSILTNSSGTNSIRVVIADGLGTTGRTVIDGFDVQAGNNVNAGGSSYAIWMRNVGPNVVVRNVSAIGGNGGAGTSGSSGNPGAAGAIGQDGITTTDTDCSCNRFSTYGGKPGDGGTSQCGGSPNAVGGAGGGSGCGEGGNDPKPAAGVNSLGGAVGGPAPSPKQNGNSGGGGGAGTRGSHGDAGLGNGTVSTQGFWSGNAGSDGSSAMNGVGGGGGSGGGGHNNGSCCAIWGGGGGGGGSGGCGGTGGTRGTAGGASFGIFIYNSSPTLLNSHFGHRNGGNGGRGGTGASGGLGKDGGAGGTGFRSNCWSGGNKSGDGGAGGRGGSGGRGGNGGGGAGGIVYGMFVTGTSSPSCVDVRYDISSGTGGLGGAGGDNFPNQPNGNSGASGAEGDRNGNFGTCQ